MRFKPTAFSWSCTGLSEKEKAFIQHSLPSTSAVYPGLRRSCQGCRNDVPGTVVCMYIQYSVVIPAPVSQVVELISKGLARHDWTWLFLLWFMLISCSSYPIEDYKRQRVCKTRFTIPSQVLPSHHMIFIRTLIRIRVHDVKLSTEPTYSV